MRTFRRTLLVTTLIAPALAVAVGHSDAEAMEAEVIHWWTSGGESAAVAVFAEQFTAAGGTWVDTAIAGGENARAAGINRIVGGNPPTVMQFNTGAQFDEIVAAGFLRDVDAVAEAQGWRDVLPEAIIDATTRDDSFYAVPVNIHGQNWLWYNSAVFADAGLEPPADFAGLVEQAPALEAAGVIPLAHGGQSWQDHLLFDAVLVAELGREPFEAIYAARDKDVVRGDGFRAAAETFGALRSLVDAGSPGRNWNDATSLVITGQAATQVMGDWAKGEFIAAGLTAGKEYGCTVLPGGYVMGGDVFVFPVVDDPAKEEAQAKMAEIMMAPDTQIAFNMKKGSVPVRLDLDVSGMDVCAQTGMAALQNPDQQVPSINFIASPDLVGATRDVITQYWNSPEMSVDDFVERFVGALEAAG
jgi:glucose/mannose transport system substrate-binding protein